MTIRRFPLLAFLLFACLSAPCRADLFISIPSVTVAAGSEFTVTITATGDAASTFNFFNVEYQITSSTAVTPYFVLAPDSLTDPTLNALNYVFAGHSLDFENNATFGPTPSIANPFPVTFDGGDSYPQALQPRRPPGRGKVITILTLQAPSFLINPIGDTYSLLLNPDPNFTSPFTSVTGARRQRPLHLFHRDDHRRHLRPRARLAHAHCHRPGRGRSGLAAAKSRSGIRQNSETAVPPLA